MLGTCGNEKASDAVVTVNLDVQGRTINIISKLKGMFGNLMEKAVEEALDELNVQNAEVTVTDFGALDFVIKARTKTATRRALTAGGKN